MFNNIKKILLLFIILTGFLISFNTLNAADPLTPDQLNLQDDEKESGRSAVFTHLDNVFSKDTQYFFQGDTTGEQGIYNFLIRFAIDLKNIFFLIAFIYLFIGVLLFLWTDMSEDDMKKWRRGMVWAGIGIIIMQISYSVLIGTLYNRDLNESSAWIIFENVILPLINLVRFLASFVFVAMAIFAFYKMVTAMGDEDSVKKGRMTIVYSIIGFIIVKIAEVLVETVYYGDCKTEDCSPAIGLDGTVGIFTTIVNYFMSFLGLAVVILSIYAGFILLTSSGDEEKLKKVKSMFIYIFIGLALMLISYALFNFFWLKDVE